MRKLKLQTQVSIDGFCAGPNGEMDWMMWNWDEDLKAFVTGISEPVDTIVLGRVTAEGFIPHWTNALANPGTADAFARKMVDSSKVVFSRTLYAHDWANTRIANGDLASEITELKNQPGGDIIAYGGARFVSNLIQTELIDELNLFINPVAIGNGLPIFSGRTKLEVMDSREYDCGIVVIQYKHPGKN